MAANRKIFQLQDVARFARPTLTDIDPVLTAAAIQEGRSGQSFLSYTQLWPFLKEAARKRHSETELANRFTAYKAPWKNKKLRECAGLLSQIVTPGARWYPASLQPIEIFPGAYFRPSLRGVLVSGGQPFMLGINPRSSQIISADDASFWARGLYELHGIDDPNDPVPMIVDLSDRYGAGRVLYSRQFDADSMMSAALFEEVITRFFQAMEIAGLTSVPKSVPDMTDLLRRRFR